VVAATTQLLWPGVIAGVAFFLTGFCEPAQGEHQPCGSKKPPLPRRRDPVGRALVRGGESVHDGRFEVRPLPAAVPGTRRVKGAGREGVSGKGAKTPAGADGGRREKPDPLRLATTLVKHEANPVLDRGRPGTWDDGRCGCFTLSRVGDGFMLWYMGSGSKNPWRIGLATSADGIRWKRAQATPVLSQGAPGRWDDRAVSMPCVLKDGDRFYLWYSGSGRGHGFGLATSRDGVSWKRHGTGPVLRGIGGSMDPCVRKLGDQFVMWYCGKVGGQYRILRATSPDGIRWKKETEPVLPLGKPGDFDSRSHAGPEVLLVGDTYFLFHLGNNGKKWTLGVATSADGVHWTKAVANPVLDVGGKDAWDGGSILGVDVLWFDGRFHVWYAAHSLADAGKDEARQAIRIGYAVSEKQP
jgi:predicted GH43/DUF377 family glycosyl hydrolase